jgi:CBS domain-containing protein
VKVSEIMTREVRTCGPEENVAAVVSKMWEGDCGAVPVVDPSRHVLGILTDRDICVALGTRNRPASEVCASEVIRNKVQSCSVEDDVRTALQKMREARVRRLPVLNSLGELEGILSIDDLVVVAKAPKFGKAAAVPADEVLQTLRALAAAGPKGKAALVS